MADDPLSKEYYALLDIVSKYDQQLLTVKGWAVTLSLAAVGFGFQFKHYGYFLLAAASGLAFWAIEALMKFNQIRYYVRMREIEVVNYERAAQAGESAQASPQIDWAWSTAPQYLRGLHSGPPPAPQRYARTPFAVWFWITPAVALPHAVSVVLGGILFWLGRAGYLDMPV